MIQDSEKTLLARHKLVVPLTFFIRGASATVPSRLTKASPPFCCGSGRFIADACGIFTGFGVSKPGLDSPAFTEGSAVGDAAAEEPASCGSFLARFLPSDIGVTGDSAAKSLPGTSLSSTSAIFAATTCTDIAAVSQSPFSNTDNESSGCEWRTDDDQVHYGLCSSITKHLNDASASAPRRFNNGHTTVISHTLIKTENEN